jgi:RNA polymerase sigma factor (sigma-70 family)
MDAILLPFLRSRDEFEREHLLSDLIFVHAAPVVRHTLRQRLGFYINALGVNPHNHDAEDLYHDVIAKLLQLLNDPQLISGEAEIKNFRQYAARVATNACHDYLRAKSPARSRLKNNLRDLLYRHQEFATWKVESETLCGFASWSGYSKSVQASSLLIELQEGASSQRSKIFRRGDIKQAPLVEVVRKILTWAEGPVELDVLVGVLAALLGIKDHPIESLADAESSYLTERLADSSLHCGSLLELRETLQYLWTEVLRLPPNQRDTFCLSFEDSSGDDLFSLLLDAGVVTWPQIAQALDRTQERLAHLWQQMPMDSAGIAAELNATRLQVNKWRFRALRQLEKELIPTLVRK